VSDRLAIGGGPVITAGTVSLVPAFFAPGRPTPLGIPTFPNGTNARPFWGGGFQLGLLYEVNDAWNVGFSYKSPVWQERWGYNASTPDLSARRIGIQADIPAIFSGGIAFKGLPRTLIDVDFRYFDYANAGLYGQRVIDGGLGWRSIFAVATAFAGIWGMNFELMPELKMWWGYPAALSLIVGTSGVLWWRFRRSGWL